ncbi:MAG: cupin domain-containing protein [Kamptonema sp. SIO4C4]|nr:cupin domain-containing protein [Kamptonema sp. SIO4C4]
MYIDPQSLPATTGSNYPEVFKARVNGRQKKRLGDAAGLTQFGVNWVQLDPGSASSVRHWHRQQDEFIYVLEGEVTLITEKRC